MKKLFGRSAVFAVVLAASGCAAFNKDKLRAELLETDRQWRQAVRGDDSDRIASFWTDDAVIYTANRPPVAGKEALRAFVGRNRSIPGFAISWDVSQAVVANAGDLAYTLGPYELTVPSAGGGLVTHTGNHICVWRHEHGTWRCMLEVHAPLPSPEKGSTGRAGERASTDRPKITTRADLPRRTYSVSTTVSDLFASPTEMKALAAKVRLGVQDVLAGHEISDKTLLKELHKAMADTALLLGESDKALLELATIVRLEEKPAARLLSGLIVTCIIRAEQAAADAGDEQRHIAFRRELNERVSAMPWKVVQEDIEQLRGRAEIMTENFLVGLIETQIEPGVQKTGHLADDTAWQMMGWRAHIDAVLPYKQDIVDVLGEIIEHNHVEKPDIWKLRNADLTHVEDLHPVLIGVWDSGVDPGVFDGRVFVNSMETLDGMDNDGNGFVDDVNGIAFSWLGDRITGSLQPLNDTDRDRLPEMKDQIKGMMDIRASLSTPEAAVVKRRLGEMAPDEVGRFMEDFWLFVNYIHGTGVAGIAVDGNPAAQILIARLEFPHEAIPPPLFEQHARKHAESFQDAIDYFKRAGVRVVNMSWGLTPKLFEKGWEANGIGEGAEERAEGGKILFDIMRDGFIRAIDSASNVLFVAAAGNSDSDSTYDMGIPASIDRPNVLTVGAVDKAGDAAGFTCFGPAVDVYANGHEVDCLLPGGDHLTLSGTSQAAPQVANLAAKLLAIDPSLSATDVAGLILDGAERTADGRILLVHPARSLDRSRSITSTTSDPN